MNKISIFSFFSGCGLLDLGFEDTGYDIVYVNEYFQPFIYAYKYSRLKMGYKKPIYGYSDNSIVNLLSQHEISILSNNINLERIKGNIVGFIGGPPCPDFSVGGRNRGKDGENGKLTETYIDLTCKLKPDFLLFENVKGLWNTKKHREFYEKVKTKLYDAGYVIMEKLVNAIEYGVPQDRDRIIMFAIQKHFLSNSNDINNFNWNIDKKFDKEEILQLNWPTINPFQTNISKPKDVPFELTVKYWFDKNSTYNHQNSQDQFKPKAGLPKFQSIPEGDVSKKSYKRLHRYRYSPTAAYGNNEVHLHPTEARRISVAEALAIQSVPACFELPLDMTLTNKFKTVGNGVPYLLSRGIANSIKVFINGLNPQFIRSKDDINSFQYYKCC
ncbi:DNA cytosine methyltransferase [Flexistipes sp.]|uniref:DNA cytosine methyltransferase n=1 Tax=Flexistipes sp. TaxID=3088135 RepID=UPI002E1AA15F|nr:DNA cytosine methyltransferase [Flexistipes sp.]